MHHPTSVLSVSVLNLLLGSGLRSWGTRKAIGSIAVAHVSIIAIVDRIGHSVL